MSLPQRVAILYLDPYGDNCCDGLGFAARAQRRWPEARIVAVVSSAGLGDSAFPGIEVIGADTPGQAGCLDFAYNKIAWRSVFDYVVRLDPEPGLLGVVDELVDAAQVDGVAIGVPTGMAEVAEINLAGPIAPAEVLGVAVKPVIQAFRREALMSVYRKGHSLWSDYGNADVGLDAAMAFGAMAEGYQPGLVPLSSVAYSGLKRPNQRFFDGLAALAK